MSPCLLFINMDESFESNYWIKQRPFWWVYLLQAGLCVYVCECVTIWWPYTADFFDCGCCCSEFYVKNDFFDNIFNSIFMQTIAVNVTIVFDTSFKNLPCHAALLVVWVIWRWFSQIRLWVWISCSLCRRPLSCFRCVPDLNGQLTIKSYNEPMV